MRHIDTYTSCYDALKTHKFCDTLDKNALLKSNHEEVLDKPKVRNIL